jgi:dolichyl-phosphate beta-glucosyltransferase
MNTLSFVIPVYNEEQRIQKTFWALKELRLPRGLTLEKIIFVDDGSQDATLMLLKKAKKTLENIMKKKGYKATVTILSYANNRGKGYAVTTGMKASDSDYTLFFDADMSTPLSEIKKIQPFIANGVEVIIGTRKNGKSTVVRHQPLVRELLGKGFTFLTQRILNTYVTDFTCGFKAIKRNAKNVIFARTTIERWSYDAEILFLAQKSGFSMQEVPVVWSNDDRSKVNLLIDIPKTLLELVMIRINALEIGKIVIKTPAPAIS